MTREFISVGVSHFQKIFGFTEADYRIKENRLGTVNNAVRLVEKVEGKISKILH
ncbi:MAG: hypothetical protein PHQ95_03010 [Candidatus Gracilibacteria bacterium]|nr:hypothetical protein [Candidatus Gracilibacteria bacterium]